VKELALATACATTMLGAAASAAGPAHRSRAKVTRARARDLSGPFRCRCADQSTGSYTWTIQGSKPRFTPLDDKRRGRSALLTPTYTRVPA
jgi:hypothetical protein